MADRTYSIRTGQNMCIKQIEQDEVTIRNPHLKERIKELERK